MRTGILIAFLVIHDALYSRPAAAVSVPETAAPVGSDESKSSSGSWLRGPALRPSASATAWPGLSVSLAAEGFH